MCACYTLIKLKMVKQNWLKTEISHIKIEILKCVNCQNAELSICVNIKISNVKSDIKTSSAQLKIGSGEVLVDWLIGFMSIN